MKKVLDFSLFFSILFLGFCIASCKNEEVRKDVIVQEAKDTSAFAQQIDSLSAILSKNPKNVPALHQRAKFYFQAKIFGKAYIDMAAVLEMDTTVPEYFLTLADLYFTTGKSGNSKAALEKCLSIDPQNVKANLKLSELYLYVQNYKRSIEYADQALKSDVNNAKAYFIKGMNFKELGDTTKAISSFRTVIDQEPEYYDAFMQLGILFSIKKNPIALQYLNSALTLRPRSVEAMYSRALIFQENGKYNSAIEDYTHMLSIEPKNRSAHFNLGYIHQEYLKVFDEAIKHYDRAIASDSLYYQAFHNRGLCKERIGNVKAAELDFRAAMKISPNYLPSVAGLNRILK